MLTKKFLVLALLLSVNLGVDAKRSARKTEKLYRKSGKWQRKLRDVWALLGVFALAFLYLICKARAARATRARALAFPLPRG